MKRSVFVSLLVVGIALLAWAFSTRGKEGMFIFSAGVGTILCTLAVGVLRLGNRATPATNTAAILGALAGCFIGGFVGASSGFGRVMISIFNPDLPEQDFAVAFGAIGGAFLGAALLALLCGTLQVLILRTKKVARAGSSQEPL